MAELFKGRAPESDYNKLLDMLNDVFFPDGNENFLALLPKLYKKKYNPCHNNFIIKEDDSIKGAVGFYYNDFYAAGEKLTNAGIGNVAVSRDSRGKGYMIECMNLCLEQMYKDADISLLGGQRQRYAHFGYEPAGCIYFFGIHESNISHLRGKDSKSNFTAVAVKESDTELLKKINALHNEFPFHAIRPDDALYDILTSWHGRPFAALDANGNFKGYFIIGGSGDIYEFIPKNADDTLDLLMCAFEVSDADSIKVKVPPCNTEIAKALSEICEYYDLGTSENICILNFENTIRVMMKVIATYQTLGDGELTMLIHGVRADENIKIRVENNTVSVCKTDEKADIELDHGTAVRFVCAPVSIERNNLPAFAARWFPLPIAVLGADTV